jgi:hypothetical protein
MLTVEECHKEIDDLAVRLAKENKILEEATLAHSKYLVEHPGPIKDPEVADEIMSLYRTCTYCREDVVILQNQLHSRISELSYALTGMFL